VEQENFLLRDSPERVGQVQRGDRCNQPISEVIGAKKGVNQGERGASDGG